MSKFAIFYSIFLALILGFLLGMYRQHGIDVERYPTLIKNTITVAQNRGFVIGCEAGIKGTHGLRESDPTEDMWTEWCFKAAISFARQSETNDLK